MPAHEKFRERSLKCSGNWCLLYYRLIGKWLLQSTLLILWWFDWNIGFNTGKGSDVDTKDIGKEKLKVAIISYAYKEAEIAIGQFIPVDWKCCFTRVYKISAMQVEYKTTGR